MTRRIAALSLLAGAALAAAPAGAMADVAGCAAPSAGGDWPMYSGTLDGHRDQTAEKAITTDNVGSLALSWKLAMPDGGKIQSVPTEADGCIFTGTDIGGIVAVNAATGKVVWKRALSDSGSGSSAFAGAGLVGAPAIANGLVYAPVTTPDASLEVALDEATGAIVWSAVVDKDSGGGDDSSPVPFDTGGGPMIFQAYQGDESSSHSNPGYTILDATREGGGQILVKNHVLPAADFAAGDRGGSIVDTPVIDPDKKLLYAGTGNPASPHQSHLTDSQIKIDVDPASPTFGQILGSVRGTSDSYPVSLVTGGDVDTGQACNPDVQWPVGRITCGSFDYNFLASGDLYTASNGHQLFAELQKSGVMQAVDTATMKVAWTQTLAEGCLGCNLASSAADASGIYVATTNGNLFSLNRDTGAVQWVRPVTGTYHFNGVSVANGVVYDPNDAGFLEAFAAADGTPLLAKSPSQDAGAPVADGENSSGISIARDTVFVPSTAPQGGGSTLFAYKLGADGGSGGGPGVPSLPGAPGVPSPPSGGGIDGHVVTAPQAQSAGYATPYVVMSAGGTLSYTNLDPVQHNVVARDKGSNGQPLFRSDFAALGATVPVPGAEKLKSGQYAFYCSLHPGMQGTLIVQ